MAEYPYWRPMSQAPRDGTHILALIHDAPDDCGYRGYTEVREVWFSPRTSPFGFSCPWLSGAPAHDGDPGGEGYGEGLLLGWLPRQALPLADSRIA